MWERSYCLKQSRCGANDGSRSAATKARFAQNVKRYDLDEKEGALVHAMARRLPGGDANELFEGLLPFEQAVDREVAETLATGSDDAALQEKEMLLQSIRKKLHFTVVEQGVPIASTRNLSSGQQVWILGANKNIVGQAMVTLIHEFSFTVKLASPDVEKLPTLSSPLRMAFTRKADGIYGVEVPIVAFNSQEGSIVCRHTLEFRGTSCGRTSGSRQISR